MNLYWREIRTHRKSLIVWCVSALFLIGVGIGKYTGISGATASAGTLIKQLPPLFRTVMGIGDFNIATASGFFGVLYLYILLLAAIHAATLGDSIIAQEERDKTAEFLFVKPISRLKVVFTKLLAAVTNVLIYNLVNLAASVIFLAMLVPQEDINHEIYLLMMGMLLVQLVFLSLGSVLAARKRGPANSRITPVLLGAFLLSYLIDLERRMDMFTVLTPFKYFPAADIIYGKGLNIGYIIWSILIMVGFSWLTYWLYNRRDLQI